jgi:hypothetical protein
MATDFGTDVAAYPDLSETFELVTGSRVVAERLWRRFSTARGGLSFHPNDGFDLRMMLNEGFSSDSLSRARSAIAAEAKKDEAVLDATVTVEYLSASKKLVVTIDGEAADGPFALTMFVTQLSVSLLEA